MYRFKEWKMIDIDLVLKTLGTMTEEARLRNVGVLPIMRDNFLFRLLCATGLRVYEALSLNVDSFTKDPDKPGLGKYGMMLVYGRKTLGRRYIRSRAVKVMDETLPAMIDYYIHEVRPRLLKEQAEKALFVSQQGARLSNAAVVHRFRGVLDKAGLDGEEFTLRSIRHTCLDCMSLTMSLEDYSKQFGYKSAFITQPLVLWPKTKLTSRRYKVSNSELS
jgi:site-specific recombinase XerD